MRTLLVSTIMLCVLALPVLAAETAEATAKRVRELEKANLVLQEDLARTQLTLDMTRGNLVNAQKSLADEIEQRKRLTTALAEETAARQALAEKLDALQKALDARLSGLDAGKATIADANALRDRVKALETAQTALTEKQAKDTDALRTDFNKQLAKAIADWQAKFDAMDKENKAAFAALRDDLDKEKAARLATEDAAAKARAKALEQAKRDRTVTYMMGGALGILSLVK